MSKYRIAVLLCFLFAVAATAPACSQKSGCPANESLRAPVDKKGNIKKSKGGSNSGLFPKDMQKRMKRGK